MKQFFDKKLVTDANFMCSLDYREKRRSLFSGKKIVPSEFHGIEVKIEQDGVAFVFAVIFQMENLCQFPVNIFISEMSIFVAIICINYANS